MTTATANTAPKFRASKRTDCHRVGAIVPSDYSFVLHYSLSSSEDGVRIPAWGVNCELEKSYWTGGQVGKGEYVRGTHAIGGMCCVTAMRSKVRFAPHGSTGKCTVCGALFTHGEIWKHDPSGEHIHIGHICGEKYELLSDYSAHEMHLVRLRNTAIQEANRILSENARSAFLAAHPGLETALQCDHRIVRDIAARFQSWNSISEKQIALVLKLASEASKPAQEAERHVPAPIGRVSFRGIVVSRKTTEGYYGWTTKLTIKVETPAGSWLVWCTAPSNLGVSESQRGAVLDMTATLTRSDREEHFAFGKRPIAKCVTAAPDNA